MKKTMLFLTLLAWGASLSATTISDQKDGDPIRRQLKWEAPAFPANEEDEIEKLYLTYITPDGKAHHIVSELPWPMPSDTFVGGDIEEEDVNFDGIPDLQVEIGYLNNSTGHNPMYYWFVWDAKSHSFVEVNEMLVAPTLDSEDERVITRMIIDDEVTMQSYVWKGFQLVLEKEWSMTMEEYLGEE